MNLDPSQYTKSLRKDCHLLVNSTTDTYCQSFSSLMTILEKRRHEDVSTCNVLVGKKTVKYWPSLD